MSKIPTAKLILTGKETCEPEYPTVSKYDALEAMIEFAKLHVEEALKQAFNNSEMRVSENDISEHPSFTDNYDDGFVTITISKESILNAYPLENIK